MTMTKSRMTTAALALAATVPSCAAFAPPSVVGGSFASKSGGCGGLVRTTTTTTTSGLCPPDLRMAKVDFGGLGNIFGLAGKKDNGNGNVDNKNENEIPVEEVNGEAEEISEMSEDNDVIGGGEAEEMPEMPEDEDDDDDDDVGGEIAAMTEAYEVALDAANERVELLTEEIDILEGELTEAVSMLESRTEELGRAGAELEDLSGTFREIGEESLAKDATIAEYEGSVEMYAALVEELEKERDDAQGRLEDATVEATRYGDERDQALAEMGLAATAADETRLSLESALQKSDGALQLAKEEAVAQAQAQAVDFGESLDAKTKGASALRKALRKARADARTIVVAASGGALGVGGVLRAEEAATAVGKQRESLDAELAELRAYLGGLEKQLLAKDASITEGKSVIEEKEKLNADVTNLRKSLDEARSQSDANAKDYGENLEKSKKEESRILQEMAEKSDAVAALEKERENDATEIESMKARVVALESGLEQRETEWEATNTALKKELDANTITMDVKWSALSLRQKEASEKIVRLTGELTASQTQVTKSAYTLAEAKSDLSNASDRADAGTLLAEGLEKDLSTVRAKLRDFGDASAKAGEDAGVQREELRAEVVRMEGLLGEASTNAAGEVEKVRLFEDRIETMTHRLLLSGRYIDEKQGTIDELKLELGDKAAAQLEADKVREESARLQKELTQTKRQVQGSHDKIAATSKKETKKRNALTKEVTHLKTKMQETEAKSVQQILSKDEDLRAKISQLEQSEAASKEAVAATVALEETLRKMSDEMSLTLARVADEEKRTGEAVEGRSEIERSLEAATVRLAESEKELSSAHAEGERLEREMGASLAQAKEDAFEKSNLLKSKHAELRTLNDAMKKEKDDGGKLQVEVGELKLALDQFQATTDNEIMLKNEAMKGKHSAEAALKSKDSEVKKAFAEMNKVKNNGLRLQSRLDKMTNELTESAAQASETIGLKVKEIETLRREVKQVVKRETVLKFTLRAKEILIQQQTALVEAATTRRRGLTTRLGKMKTDLKSFTTSTVDENAKLKAKLEERRQARLNAAGAKKPVAAGKKDDEAKR